MVPFTVPNPEAGGATIDNVCAGHPAETEKLTPFVPGSSNGLRASSVPDGRQTTRS